MLLRYDEIEHIKPGDLMSDAWSEPEHEPALIVQVARVRPNRVWIWVWRPSEDMEEMRRHYEINPTFCDDRRWIEHDFRLISKAP
jgi:hypothetical protein